MAWNSCPICVKLFRIASIVLFSSSEAFAIFAKIFAISFLSLFNGMYFLTSIFPSVKVPVLSKQSVSTLASVSIQYNSCTNTLECDNLITLTAKTVLVNNTKPSGIIPITAATVFTTAVCQVAPCTWNWE